MTKRVFLVDCTVYGDPLRRLRRQRGCLLDGAKTVTLFGSMEEAGRRLATDGLAADWANVGADLRTAIAAEKMRREREVG